MSFALNLNVSSEIITFEYRISIRLIHQIDIGYWISNINQIDFRYSNSAKNSFLILNIEYPPDF